MKSLLDIQREIRELDGKVKDISSSISEIYDTIDDLRNDETEIIDYEMIRTLSMHFNFGEHPLDKLEDGYACRLYLEVLMHLIHSDQGSQATIDRLIFVQWILTQARLDISFEELYKDSLSINSAVYAELVELLPENYENHLVMDALLTANICGQASMDILSYVVNLCGILGVNKERMKRFSVIAKWILQQKLEKIKTSDIEQILICAVEFKHYLTNETLGRTIAIEAPDRTYSNFKWKVKQHEYVKQGDVIATCGFGRSKYSTSSMNEIKAPCSGTLFQFRNNCINYGVIAHEYDNKDSIKEWALQRR